MKSRFISRPHSSLYQVHLQSPEWRQFCRYVISAQGGRCRRCRDMKPLEVHHLHYLTLGRESLKDVEALCHECHKIADEEREQEAWNRRVIGWARKKYGTYWSSLMDFEDVEAEFADWLELRKLL